ncbi:MAG: riboflavin synthase [Planctomycetota bacterium]
MFTGIVQTQGKLLTLARNDFGAHLTVGRGDLTTPVAHGDSVCVSGVCLTAIQITNDTLRFDVIAETLDKTKLGDLAEGDAVNLEPAVTPNQPLGGHFMQGHVDGVGEVVGVLDTPEEWRTTVRPPADLMGYIVSKGSIAIDGVSLTIASVSDGGTFDVALIPETLSRTTLGATGVGDRVNLEADILAKTVVNWLERTASAGPSAKQEVTMDLLRKAGFASP